MTREEFRECIRFLRKYYRRAALLQDKETVSQWYEDLKQFPYVLILTGLKAWVANNSSPDIPSLEKTSYPVSSSVNWTISKNIVARV